MTRPESMEDQSREGERSLRLKGILSGTIPVIIMGAVLFVSAGTLDWPMAWVLLAALFAATTLVTLFCSPDPVVR